MIPTSSFIIPPSPFLPARLSKQMKQRLESVPEHRRTIAKEGITRLMRRSFQFACDLGFMVTQID